MKTKKVQPKQHRQRVTCWIKWNISKDGECHVQLLYWRREIYFVDVHAKSLKEQNPDNVAARWWDAQEKCKRWAIKEGFEVIKEKLHHG